MSIMEEYILYYSHYEYHGGVYTILLTLWSISSDSCSSLVSNPDIFRLPIIEKLMVHMGMS